MRVARKRQMKPTVPSTPFRRFKARARRGSLVVTSFIVIVGMAMIVGGIHQMLSTQLDQAYEIQRISFAKLQVKYLAEMGVNHMMYIANKTANVGDGTTNPWSAISMGAGTGSAISVDFKDKVAMTRGVSGASATCTISRTGANAFSVLGTLVVPNVGTYTETVSFSAAYDAGGGGYPAAWELASFQSF